MDRQTRKDWVLLGAWVARERKRQGFESQEALAAAAGVGMRTVQRLEGGTQISDGNLRKIEDALGLETNQLDDVLFGFEPARAVTTAPVVTPTGPVDYTDRWQVIAALQLAANLGDAPFTAVLKEALANRPD